MNHIQWVKSLKIFTNRSGQAGGGQPDRFFPVFFYAFPNTEPLKISNSALHPDVTFPQRALKTPNISLLLLLTQVPHSKQSARPLVDVSTGN